MRKYIAYAKRYCKPKLTEEAIEHIKEFFVGLRSKGMSGDDEALKPIPISARQLEALIRLSQASARVRLSDIVTLKDAKNAIKLLKNCLQQVGMDTETGELDIDRIVTGITTSQRNKIFQVRDIIKEMEAKFGANIPIADIIDAAKAKGLEESKVEEIIEKMRRDGEIFEPKHGVIRKLQG
jgi:replicative DNA helicase Mcm